MNAAESSKVIDVYIATLPLTNFGNYFYAYSLLVHAPKGQSWHWGVKTPEDQWVDMEMFGLKRVLLAMSVEDPDRNFRLKARLRGTYLEQRLSMAAKTKRDIDRGLKIEKLHNHQDWMDTTTLWDLYKEGMREATTQDELCFLRMAAQNIETEHNRISSPLKIRVPFLECSCELVLGI